tara:strand:- start:1 stop:2814 length:2814 start_codon:yes stop_codon:yes gene_type:complete
MNILPPSKANTRKLLSGTPSVSSNKEILTEPKNNLLGIKKQVDEIKNLVTNLTTLKKKSLKLKRKEDYQNRFAEKEKKLEEKKKPEDNNKIKMPNTPKLGFLDVIKRFIVNTLFGYIAVRLIDHLPKLIEVAGLLGNALDFITDFGEKIFNGLSTFIQKGYEAYDFTRNTLKSFGGDNALKLFDGFNKALDGVILAALAASFALADMAGGDSGGGRGIDAVKGARGAASTANQSAGLGTAGTVAVVAGAGLLSSALGEGAFQLKKLGNKNVEKSKKSYDNEKNWLMKPIRWVGYQQSRLSNFTLGTIGVLLDIVGAPFRYAIELIRYSFLSDEDKKKQAKNLAKFDARIREQFREGLNALSFGSLFKEKGSFGNIYGDKGSQKDMMSKMKGGGQTPVTRGGKLVGGAPKRKIKKSKKRTINVQPTPIKPGSSVGGEKKIETVFPQTTDKNVVNPLGYIKSSYSKISEEPFFGSLMGISMKSLVGQKPSKVDYRNAAQGLNNWMNVTFSDEILRTGSLYAAGGGEVNAEMLSRMGGDMTDVIAKSLEESISKKVDDAINDLMKQMMLKPNVIEREKPPGQEPGVDTGGGGSATDAIGGARLFMSEGFPMLAAAILAGNVQAESAWKGQRTPWVLNDGAGTNKGLISWNRSRIVNAEKFLGKPLETASNAEQVRWIKEELRQYGLLDEFMDPNRTESQLKSDSYKYIGWGIEGDRWTQSTRIFAALQKGEQGTFIPGSMDTGDNLAKGKQRKGFPTGYPPSRPGLFDVIEYITGDRRHSNFDLEDHGTPANYHDHIAFSSIANKERAKRALIASNIQIGSELRPGDRGYHGINLAIDIRGGQWGGSGAIGETEFAGSRKVRKVLGLREGGYIEPVRNKRNTKSLQSFASYDNSGSQVIYVKLPKPTVVPVPMPIPMGAGGGSISNSSSYDYTQGLHTHA